MAKHHYFNNSSRSLLMSLLLMSLSFQTAQPVFSLPLAGTPKYQTNLIKQSNSDWGGEHSGNQTGTGIRDGCPETEYPLTALMPEGVNWSLTTQPYPTLWFYLPYSADEVAAAALILEDKPNNVYLELPLTFPEEPGFVSVTIPETIEPLTSGTDYSWALTLYCSEESITPIIVEGWIQFSADSQSLPQAYQTYVNNWIWVDAVNALALQRLQEPENLLLVDEWQRLLQDGGIESSELPVGPIIGAGVVSNPQS